MGTEAAITAYGIPLAPLTSFKCLGIVLLALDDDCSELVHKIWREWQKWEHLSRVLIREGADAHTLGIIYVAVFQVVMLYGLETWVMSPCIGVVWGGLRHRVIHRLIR